jgi:hypothetical protein
VLYLQLWQDLFNEYLKTNTLENNVHVVRKVLPAAYSEFLSLSNYDLMLNCITGSK